MKIKDSKFVSGKVVERIRNIPDRIISECISAGI
jgi:hypothetical protein